MLLILRPSIYRKQAMAAPKGNLSSIYIKLFPLIQWGIYGVFLGFLHCAQDYFSYIETMPALLWEESPAFALGKTSTINMMRVTCESHTHVRLETNRHTRTGFGLTTSLLIISSAMQVSS